MNIFTTCQLSNHNKPTVYYDTTSNKIKLSTIPMQTMLGNKSMDISLTDTFYNKSKKTQCEKTTNMPYHVNKNREKYIKKNRKTEHPDKLRCCANTRDGNRCSLRRYTQKSEDLCYIHYKRQLKSTIKDNQIKHVEQELVHIPKTKKWYSRFKKRFLGN